MSQMFQMDANTIWFSSFILSICKISQNFSVISRMNKIILFILDFWFTMLRGHRPYIEYSSDRCQHDVNVFMAQWTSRSTRESSLHTKQLPNPQESHEFLAAYVQRSVHFLRQVVLQLPHEDARRYSQEILRIESAERVENEASIDPHQFSHRSE